ncbi:hypothetical protein QUC31_001877, partial [Theobroma cacao]
SDFLSISMGVEPPFFEKYKAILQRSVEKEKFSTIEVFEEFELPLIDLSSLILGPFERQKCIEQMAEAASEWGSFQIVNHGIPGGLLDRLKHEQMKVFHLPFDKKAEKKFLNLSAHSYRWGNPLATSLRNLSWSEALHISLKDISRMDECNKLRLLNQQEKENRKGYMALSNGIYKSITHRVAANEEVERYSIAYFYCPTDEVVIQSCSEPALYRNFSFKEYREQIERDVKATGDKVGLSRFLG